MSKLIYPKADEPPLDLLRRCRGFYECPKAADGTRLGPLVGYAGRDDQGRQYVGDVYANFAKIEQHGPALLHTAELLWAKILHMGFLDFAGFCGAPEGGKALATTLATVYQRQYIFPDKKVISLATETSREKSKLIFSRHDAPEPDTAWWIVEDVCNNFSTTMEIVNLIQASGARVLGIVCFLNRSMVVDAVYTTSAGMPLPVLSVVRKPFDQWKQDDPIVADDIARKNVIFKPKEQWDNLEKAMAA